jgi:hypothetical protein
MFFQRINFLRRGASALEDLSIEAIATLALPCQHTFFTGGHAG